MEKAVCSKHYMYIALGSIPTGIATTIFFIYPTITILLMWAFFRDKPSLPLVFAMVTIYIGGFMTIPAAAFTPKGEGNFVGKEIDRLRVVQSFFLYIQTNVLYLRTNLRC